MLKIWALLINYKGWWWQLDKALLLKAIQLIVAENLLAAYNIYSRYFESQIKVKDNQLSKTLDMKNPKFSKEFFIEKDGSQFNIMIRYQDNITKVFVKPTSSQPPIFVYLVFVH